MRRLLIFFTMLVLAAVLVGGAALARFISHYGATPVLNQTVETVLIKPGTGFSTLLGELEQRSLIDDAYKTEVYLKFKGQTRFKAGEFQVEPGLTLDQLWQRFNSSKVVHYVFTIVEGDNIYQIRDKLKSAQFVDFDLSSNPLEWRIDGFAQASLEGWLYPETYHYTRQTKASTLLKRAFNAANKQVDQIFKLDISEHIKTPQQLVTLASIIEKETGVISERPLISSVFHNRLNKKMRLQTDPTVIYGMLPDFNGNITRQDLRTPTPYNTYRINGLPPGPIASVGKASLIAALYPAKTELYYFVAKGDGSHQFSKTLAEHNKAVQHYQRSKRRSDYRSSQQ